MCWWNTGSSSGSSNAQTYTSKETTSANEENKEAAKAKARLLETSGGNKGAELTAQQGRSVRRIFG